MSALVSPVDDREYVEEFEFSTLPAYRIPYAQRLTLGSAAQLSHSASLQQQHNDAMEAAKQHGAPNQSHYCQPPHVGQLLSPPKASLAHHHGANKETLSHVPLVSQYVSSVNTDVDLPSNFNRGKAINSYYYEPMQQPAHLQQVQEQPSLQQRVLPNSLQNKGALQTAQSIVDHTANNVGRQSMYYWSALPRAYYMEPASLTKATLSERDESETLSTSLSGHDQPTFKLSTGEIAPRSVYAADRRPVTAPPRQRLQVQEHSGNELSGQLGSQMTPQVHTAVSKPILSAYMQMPLRTARQPSQTAMPPKASKHINVNRSQDGAKPDSMYYAAHMRSTEPVTNNRHLPSSTLASGAPVSAYVLADLRGGAELSPDVEDPDVAFSQMDAWEYCRYKHAADVPRTVSGQTILGFEHYRSAR